MDGKVRVWDREKNECYNELNSVGTSCVHALLSYDNILVRACNAWLTALLSPHSPIMLTHFILVSPSYIAAVLGERGQQHTRHGTTDA
jgi:hypothetical protein